MKKRSGFGWVLLSTVCFWGVLLLGPVLLALWDAVSIFRLDPNSLAYAVFSLLAQPISAGLAFYLSGAVLSDDAALPPCVNAVISASVLGVLTLLSASSQMAMLSYVITIVVLVICAVFGFRKYSASKTSVPTSANTASPVRAEPSNGPPKRPERLPNISPYNRTPEYLDEIVEQAYKDQYLVALKEFEALIGSAKSERPTGGVFTIRTQDVRDQYRDNVLTQVLSDIQKTVHLGLRTTTDFDTLQWSITKRSSPDFGGIYAKLYRDLTGMECPAEKQRHQAERFKMYADAAFEHAARKYGLVTERK